MPVVSRHCNLLMVKGHHDFLICLNKKNVPTELAVVSVSAFAISSWLVHIIGPSSRILCRTSA